MPHRFASLLLALLASSCRASFPKGTSSIVALQNHRSLEESFEYDLTGFGVRFERCQYVKMFDDELAEDEDADTVLALKHFVVYKLCPEDECNSCDGTHGEYVVDVQDYLEATIEYEKRAFEYMCDNCNQEECGQVCYDYDNMENNGYVDAAEYIECQRVDNGDDDGGEELYVGPRCSSNNNAIKIGLFSDEDCFVPYYDEDVEDVLGVKLSYQILQNVQSNDGDAMCLSCKEQDDGNENNNNGNDADGDVDDVNEMCEAIYEASGKCESIYGLDLGFVQMNREDGDYENQVENEFMVCNFINSLIWNSYTETGEINSVDEQDVAIRTMMPLQKVSLTLLTITAVALAGYAYYLHREIEKHSPKNKVKLSALADKEVI